MFDTTTETGTGTGTDIPRSNSYHPFSIFHFPFSIFHFPFSNRSSLSRVSQEGRLFVIVLKSSLKSSLRALIRFCIACSSSSRDQEPDSGEDG
jgi:hypothetical protein